MTEQKQSGYDALGKVIVGLALFVAAAIVNGLVLTRLWAWFVAATFHVQGLTVAEAIGLALTVRFILATEPQKNDKKSFSALIGEGLLRLVMVNGFVLLTGLVVVQFT